MTLFFLPYDVYFIAIIEGYLLGGQHENLLERRY